MKQFIVDEHAFSAVLNYLADRPWREVHQLLVTLQSSKLYSADSVGDNQTEPKAPE